MVVADARRNRRGRGQGGGNYDEGKNGGRAGGYYGGGMSGGRDGGNYGGGMSGGRGGGNYGGGRSGGTRKPYHNSHWANVSRGCYRDGNHSWRGKKERREYNKK